jgi:hypothetical protein
MSDLPSAEERLDRIESELAIRQLPVRYALATDSRDIDGWVRLFVPDVRVGRDASGRAALAAYTAPRLRAFRRSVHFVGAHQVDLDPADPDRATGAVYCRAEHEVGDQWIVMDICYFDTYRRVDGEWLFQRRKAKHWYSADLLDRPQAVGFNGWAHPRPATLPGDFPTWDPFWAGE